MVVLCGRGHVFQYSSARQKSRKSQKSRKIGRSYANTPLDMINDDRNGHITSHLPLRSHEINIIKSYSLAKSDEMKCYFNVGMNNIVPSVDKTFSTTAVIILVISLIIVIIGSL